MRTKVKEAIALYQRSPEFRALKPSTQKGHNSALTRIHEAFGNLAFEEITPFLIRSYLRQRSAKVGANREISLLSVVWQWAREEDLTRAQNQCKGVKRNREVPRDRYVTDAELERAIAAGPDWLADTIRLGYLTGQRIGDILPLRRSDVAGNVLRVRQGKTGARVAIAIEGELAEVVRGILERPRKVSSIWLICDDQGRRITAYQHWYAFRRTGATWHFHDLRAKAVSDIVEATGEIRPAQALAGHTSQKTTETVYVRLRGRPVKPVR